MTCVSYELVPDQPLNADCQKFSESVGLVLCRPVFMTCGYVHVSSNKVHVEGV